MACFLKLNATFKLSLATMFSVQVELGKITADPEMHVKRV